MTCWVISDGRRGIENQAAGLAEALGRLTPLNIERHTLSPSNIFKALPPLLQVNLKRTPQSYGLPQTPPSIVIGCGRQAIAPLLAIKKAFGSQTFTTYIQDPHIDPKHFNYVIAPQHDNLSGPNVDTIIGSPNRLSPEQFEEALERFKSELAVLPSQRVAVLIGGTSKAYAYTHEGAQIHIRAILDLTNSGYGVMVSLSRRTPKAIAALYQENLAGKPNIWFYTGTGNNPYFAFIGSARAVLVTEESTNMLTEACATGKPVFTLPMEKKNKHKPSKFESLHSQLSERCQLRPYTNTKDLTNILDSFKPYTPLNETERAAKRLFEKLKTTKSV